MDSFAQLSPLVHLTALKLDDVRFDQATLEQARLTPLFGVRKLEFCRVKYLEFNPSIGNFCRFISSIFPDVQELSLDFSYRVRIMIKKTILFTFLFINL